MKLIFCLYEYFPYGGLQRDLMKITAIAVSRGHSVKILTMGWHGDIPDGLDVQILPHSAFSNHRRCLKFARTVVNLLPKLSYDAVVGFNKMQGLDVYYAADSCYQARTRKLGALASFVMGRYSTYVGFEKAIFSPESKTEILSISPQEQRKFIECYGTPEERFHLLPPGIYEDRFRPANAAEVRSRIRGDLGLLEDQLMLLMVGSAFHTKGVDRAINAIASLPQDLRKRVKLYVLGRGKIELFSKIAEKNNLVEQVNFLGGREDVPDFLLAADLLVHPARTENTGTVLIEAMAAGLPVVVTENCGYAFHVQEADSGRIVPMPFEQKALDKALSDVLSSSDLSRFAENGVKYTARVDVTGLHEKAVDVIEDVARRRSRS
ncbi:glycosyltransferase family 4 protein [Deltaproteobacteria bacterium IMCC39524]|nr:glycosyltransferase family 4 protein [Deltaproteobacteria bacterium IMCC39524]